MKKTVIIQASAKSFGNTHKVVSYLNKDQEFTIIDLKTKNIGPFEYDFSNANDDFLPLIEQIIKNYNTIIFATPVYWYTMSGILKTFFDRISDLLYFKKELGRKLRGKKMAMISNSAENDRHKGFKMPFIESANYLGMHYLGDIHTWFNGEGIDEEAKQLIDGFKKLL